MLTVAAFLPDLDQPLAGAGPLLTLAVVILTGVVFGSGAKVVRLPSVTGQILAGVLIGKVGFDLFGDAPVEGLVPLTHFALGLIAFTVGSHLNVRRLHNAGKRLFLLLLTESTITPVVILAALWALGGAEGQTKTSLLLAATAIATAPATIVALVKETRAKGVFVKTLIAAVALNNMACIVLFEVARAFLRAPQEGGSTFVQYLGEPAMQLVAAIVIGASMGLVVELIGRTTVRRQRLATAAIAALLLASGAAQYADVSPLLACLVMGLVQTNLSPSREKLVDTAFEDFEPVILAVFFTLAGMHLQLEHLPTVGLIAVLFLFARAGGKVLAADLAMRLAGATDRVRRNLGPALVPQAGVAVGLVILIQEDVGFSDIAGDFAAIVLSVVTINEIVGPILTRRGLSRSGEAGMDRSRLIDFLTEQNIVTDLEADTQEQAVRKLVEVLVRSHRLKEVDQAAFLQSVLDREAEMSTCLGGGLAIPHGEIAQSEGIYGVMGLSRQGLNFPTPDGQPVHCMVLLATPPDQRQRHLEVLAALARHIGTNPTVQRGLFNASSAAHAYEIIHGEEAMDFNYFLQEQ